DVQEAIEVDAHRGVEDATHELRRRRSAKALVDGVREGERMERGVPIAELVARVEAGDPERGGPRDGGGDPLWSRAPSESSEQRLRDRLGGVSEQYRLVQWPGGVGALFQEPLVRALDDRDDVDRIAPRVRLFHPGRVRVRVG